MSPIITNTPPAKEISNAWERVVQKAKSFFSNIYSHKESSHKGTAALTEVRNMLETVLQIRITEAVQRNPRMPQVVLDNLAILGTERLDEITKNILMPNVQRGFKVKELIIIANQEMEKAVKEMEEVSSADILWDALIIKANQGKKFTSQEERTYMVMAERSFHHNLELIYEQAARNGNISKGTFMDAVGGMWDELEEKYMEMLEDVPVGSRIRAMFIDALMHSKLSAVKEIFVGNTDKEPSSTVCLLKVDGGYSLNRLVQVENVVLQGGGGKGIGYVSLLQEMSRGGAFDNLKRVSGSSAGALTAVALGCGVPIDQLKEAGENIQKAAIGRTTVSTKRLYPGLLKMFIFGIAFFGKAAGVVKEIDLLSHRNVKTFLDGLSENDLAGLTNQERERVKLLMEPYGRRTRMPHDGSSERCPMVTFGDLAMLRKLPGGSIFKELTITGWNATQKRTTYFDHNTTPHMPIALAARISMALPFAFNGVQIDISRYGHNPNARSRKVNMYDGGIGSNLPSEVFVRNYEGQPEWARAGEQARTVSFIFDNNGEAESALSRGSGFQDSWKNKILSILLGLTSYTGLFRGTYEQHIVAEERKKNELGRIVVVSHGEIGTTDISVPEGTQRAVLLMSQLRATQWIDQHRNERFSINCESAEEAARLLSEDELRQVIGGLEASLQNGGSQTDAEFLVACQIERQARITPGFIR